MKQVDKSIAPLIMPGVEINVVKNSHQYHTCNEKRANFTTPKKYKMKDVAGEVKIHRLYKKGKYDCSTKIVCYTEENIFVLTQRR